MPGDPRVLAERDLAPHDRVDLGPLRRATVSAVVLLGLVVNVVMMPLVMPEGLDAMMLLVAPGPPVAIEPGGRVHPARLLVIVVRLVHPVMMIATALPVTMIRLLTRMRRPVNLIALRGAS